MSGASSNAAEWFTRLEPALPGDTTCRPDDPRLAEVIEIWNGNLSALTPGRGVILGFPQDEGVRRNNGRPGAAEAPSQIRQWLYRLTPGPTGVSLTDRPPLDIGNIRIQGSLEDSQLELGLILTEILKTAAVPIVLGGGHETAYGHYLGYVGANLPVGVVNLDSHLDVRPRVDGRGHSGSPFREAMEHPTVALPGKRYSCLGAQPYSVSRQHYEFVRKEGGVIHWCDTVRDTLVDVFQRELDRLSRAGLRVYVTLDADVVAAADVPGVSAPNIAGLSGVQLLSCARAAGYSPQVASFDLVEINPALDHDQRSSRWAALAVWNFLTGLTSRRRTFRPSGHLPWP
jgi:formiminoglutamase